MVPYTETLNSTITKIRLYNFDPLKPHFYIVKLGLTGFPKLPLYVITFSDQPPHFFSDSENLRDAFLLIILMRMHSDVYLFSAKVNGENFPW